MEEVYDFASLAFAAMPYRFLYLTVDTWPSAIIVFIIKYVYKFIVYFLTLKYSKKLKAIKHKLRVICIKKKRLV